MRLKLTSISVLAAILLSSCTSTTMVSAPNLTQTSPPLPAFDMEGHRGARGLMPENTLPAMIKALELGVTTLEMDVHISKDGQVLLSHDPYLNPEHELLPSGQDIPAADVKKHVLYQMNYADIKKFDVGSKPYSRFPQQQLQPTYKPLLSEVIDTTQAYLQAHRLPQVFYNIETKSTSSGDGKYHPAPEEFVAKLLDVLQEKEVLPFVIIQSFDVRTLQVLHQKYPGVKTALLVENMKSLDKNLDLLGFTPTIYSPNFKLITPQLVQLVHSKGMKLIPWTVNDLKKMRKLKRLGVDGLISDYPDLFQHL